MSQSAVLEQEDMQNEQDSVQPDPLLASPNQTNVNQLPLLQYRNGFFQGHIDEYSQRQGKGVYYWNSGEIYYGDWNQDRMEGEGIFYFAFGGYAYGTFLEDKVHGYAVLCFSNGDYIAGFWERGVLTGKVIQYSKGPDDWCLYEYKDGSPEKVAANGKGKPPISTFSMIESVHLQKLVDRELDIFIPEGGDSRLGFLPIGEQGWYHGFSSEIGNPHGLGVICHLENKIDRGLFKEGNLDGPGRSIFENGDVYDGFFKGGKFNGAGVYFKSQTEQYLYGVYENSECVQALTLGNGYPHELIRTLKGDFKLEEAEYIDKDTDFEVLILSELSRAQSMAEGVDQREWMSISRNAHEESRDQSLPLESQRSKTNGSRGNLESEKQQQVASNKNVSSVKSVKSVKEEKSVMSHASNGSNASVKSRASQGKVPSQPQRISGSAHNSRTSVQSKGRKQVDSRTSVHEEVVVQQQKSGYSSIESNRKSGPKNPSSEAKSRQQAVSREISERGSAHHVSNKSQKEAINSESNKKSTPVVSGGGNKSSDRNVSIGSRRLVEDLQKHDSNVLDANFVNINNKKGGLRESSPEIKRKFTEESPSRHTKSEVLEIHSARSGHSDRLNRKTHETINNEVTNIMDQIFRSGTEPRDSHHTRENPTEQSQGAIYYDLNGSFGSPVKTQQSQREHVKRAHLPDHEQSRNSRRSDLDNSRQSSRGDLADAGSEIKAKTSINDRKVEHSKQESYEEEQKDHVDQGLGNQTLEYLIKNLGREVKSEILDGQLSNRLSLRKKTTEGYSEANQHQVVIEEEIYRIMMSKIELLLKEQTKTTEKLDEIKRIIDTKLDPLLKNQTQGNQVLKRELNEKVGILAREKDYDSNVDILRKMHQDLVHHTRLSNISLNITHTKLDTLLVHQDIPSPYIGHPDCVLDVPLNQEILSGQIFKSQYDKSMMEAGSAATTLEQPNSAFLNRTTTTQHMIVKEQPKSSHHPFKVSHQQPAFDEADYMSITSDSAPLKTVNAFTPHAKELAAKNERMFGEFTPYQSKDSALSQSIVKFRNSIRQATEHNNSSAPENQLSSGNYVLTQTPRDKITYLRTEESVQQSSEPILMSHRSHKSSSKNEAAPVTPQRSVMRESKYSQREISPEKEPNVSPDRREHGGNSTPRPKESTGSNVKDKSRWNLGFCGQSEDIEEPEAFLGPKKFMKTSNVQHQTEDSRILQTQGQETNRSHSSQTQTQLRPPQQQQSGGMMKKSNASYKPSSLKLIENLHGSRVEDTQQSHRSQASHRSQRSQRESARRNDTGPISDLSVFDHFVVTSNNNRIPSPSAGEYIRIEKGSASQRSMAFMKGQSPEVHRGTQSASAHKYPVENNLRVREVNLYEEEGSQIYDDRMNTQQNTLPDENVPWRNSVGGNSSYIHTGVSPIKIRREPLSAQNPMKNSVHEGRLGSVRWRLELEVDEEFDNRSPISKRNIVEEILGVDPVEDDVNTIQYHKVPQQSIKSSKMVSTTVAGGLTSERNWGRQQYVPQEQIHQDIYYVNEGDDPLSSRRSYKMSEQSRRNYPETKVVYPAQALENMAVMRTHPDDYIEKVVNREVSTRKSGKSSYNVIEDEDYTNHSNRLDNVQIKAWDQGLIDNLNNRGGQSQNNIRVYKNQYM